MVITVGTICCGSLLMLVSVTSSTSKTNTTVLLDLPILCGRLLIIVDYCRLSRVNSIRKHTSPAQSRSNIMRLTSQTRFAFGTVLLLANSHNGTFGFSPLSVQVRTSPSRRPTIRSRSRTAATPDPVQDADADADEQEDPISLNPLVASVKVSKTVEIFSLVKQMEAEGTKVTSLCVGEPDFLPPQAVLDATVEAVQAGDTRYTAVTGTAPLRQAIVDDLKRRKGLEYAPTDVVVGNGAKQCVYQGVLAVCGPGDGVIVPAPFWPSYPEMVALAGADPIILETNANDGFLITPEALRQTLETHPHIKLLILCNPSNPTGGVHNQQRLEQLAQVLEDYPQVAILADEIYERLVYSDNGVCPAFAAMPHMFHRTMTVNGFSKAYAMTGMRLGYVAAPSKFAKAITTIQSQLTSCAGSISQAAGVAALTQVPDQELEANVQIMKQKRDYVLERLAKMNNVHVAVPPNGAFYLLPEVSSYFNGDDAELCLQLLKSKQLALVPGSSFGAPGTIRISYATSMDELNIACNKLEQFLQEHE